MKKGFALITVLAVLIMVALGTAAILQSVGSHASMKSLSVQELKDQYLAEAGMQHALWVCGTNNGNCALANVTLATATTGLDKAITIVTNPTTSGAASYQIKVCVGGGTCTIP